MADWGERVLRKAGLDGRCRFLLADFMQVPLPDCHSVHSQMRIPWTGCSESTGLPRVEVVS